MKNFMNEYAMFSRMADKLLSEAKKKKEKAEELKNKATPEAYSYSEAFDFSAPLGAYNLYRTQGAVNWGPMTGPGSKVDDRIVGQRASLESLTKGVVKEMTNKSAWEPLAESVAPSNVWEAANHWFDFENLGLGRQNEEGIKNKKKKNAKDKKSKK